MRLLREQKRHAVYALNLFFSLSLAVSTFFFTPFLVERGVPENVIGIIYSIAFLCGGFGLIASSSLVARIGAFQAFMCAVTLSIAAFLLLPFATHAAFAALLFIWISALTVFLMFILDIFVEKTVSHEGTTGGVRGTFITMANIAWVIAPLAAGVIIASGGFDRLFTITALLLLPLIFISILALSSFARHRGEVHVLHFRAFLKRLRRDADLRHIFFAQFMLRMFYGVMSAYTPLYLIQYVGLPVESLGIVLAVMVLPFLILELPLGYLADKKWGEQEILIAGFFLISATTIVLSFIASTSIVVWTAALFATRVGAAMIDIGTETYFFKHVDAGDADAMSAFRMLYPLGYIIGPLVASAFVTAAPISYMYALLGSVMLIALPAVILIHDTK